MVLSIPRGPIEALTKSLIGKEDFSTPAGEPSVVGSDSVSWRVFANPVAMYIGGTTAVLLELGEPRVRHGVWDHSSFRRDPARRLRRTGLAAMVTVYGARSRFEAMAARVRRMHETVSGITPEGLPYHASDPALLRWVQVTAAWAFLHAYDAYASPVCAADRDRYYAEGRAGATLYGVEEPPGSKAEVEAIFAAMEPKLGPSAILEDLLRILRRAPILPLPLRPMQAVVTRAAVDLLPRRLQLRLGLASHGRMRFGERALLRALARAADRIEPRSSPRAQARLRMARTLPALDNVPIMF